MIRRRVTRLTLFLLLALILAACALPGQASFDRKAMLAHIATTVIMPHHEAFVSQTTLLHQAATSFAAAPTTASLEALQQQWRSTSDAWAQCVLFAPDAAMVLHSQIDKWPTRDEFIEQTIAEHESIDGALVAGLGSTSKGLPAIEYLIFGPTRDSAAVLAQFTHEPRASQRSQYLVALTEQLDVSAQALRNLWATSGENYTQQFIDAAGEGSDLQGSISMLNNDMVSLLERIVQTKLGKPLGKQSYGKPRPETVETPYSAQSLAVIRGNLASIRAAFSGGGTEAAQLGLDDYLIFLGAAPLAQQIRAQLDKTDAALDAVELPLHEAVVTKPEQAENLYKETRALLVLVKVDLASRLGVTVTFTDNDGD